MNDLDKLRVLLPHWIEHNSGHSDEFKKWSVTAQKAGEDQIAELLNKAVVSLGVADKALKEALERAGGTLAEHSHSHDHHHHH